MEIPSLLSYRLNDEEGAEEQEKKVQVKDDVTHSVE